MSSTRKRIFFVSWGLLPFPLWFAIIFLAHYDLLGASNGLRGWMILVPIVFIGGLACFVLSVPLPWRVLAFIVYLPCVAFAIYAFGVAFDTIVFGTTP
jgi:hypothetical protein